MEAFSPIIQTQIQFSIDFLICNLIMLLENACYILTAGFAVSTLASQQESLGPILSCVFFVSMFSSCMCGVVLGTLASPHLPKTRTIG